MTWLAVLVSALLVAAILPFGLFAGWWLERTFRRTDGIWPVLVVVVVAFVYAVGLTACVVQLWPEGLAS